LTLPGLEQQITEAVERLSESVVSIDSTRLARNMYGVVPIEGGGSGFILDARGLIVTNNHVIDNAAQVQVHLKDGRTFVGEVVASDPATDVAVIRVEAQNLPAAELADSEKLKVGQIVLAIGNTLRLPGGHTVSMGVISALGRPLPGADFIFEGLIQTDAAINPGNSGGPLADLNGRVLGINTAMIPFAQGVGFALPINTVKAVVDQILERGRVIRPWLGISGTNLNPGIVRRYDLPTETGVLVVETVARSPADEAGLRAGDILIQIGPHEIGQMRDLLAALAKLAIGAEVEVIFLRDRRKYRSTLRLVEAPMRVRVRSE
jgi:S1-C subfamily serine protease